MKLTKEQQLTLENKKLKQIVADLLHTMQKIHMAKPDVEMAKQAIAKAIRDYTEIRKK